MQWQSRGTVQKWVHQRKLQTNPKMALSQTPQNKVSSLPQSSKIIKGLWQGLLPKQQVLQGNKESLSEAARVSSSLSHLCSREACRQLLVSGEHSWRNKEQLWRWHDDGRLGKIIVWVKAQLLLLTTVTVNSEKNATCDTEVALTLWIMCHGADASSSPVSPVSPELRLLWKLCLWQFFLSLNLDDVTAQV